MTDERTVFEQMDLNDQQHRFDMELEREKTRQRRADQRGPIAGWTAGALVLVSIVAGGTYLIASKPNGTRYEIQREQTCIQDGGGWVPKDLLSSSGRGLCVFPGKVAHQ